MRSSTKQKGDFSRESSPSLSEFFEDLVRLPNHNIVISESPVIHKLTPAFPLILPLSHRCERFLRSSVVSGFPYVLGPRCRLPLCPSVALFVWKIALPLLSK